MGTGGVAALVALDPVSRLGLGISEANVAVRRLAHTMGTEIQFTVLSEGKETHAVLDAAIGRIEAVNQLMSVHRADSELGQLNETGDLTSASPHTFNVANIALDIARKTDGALDPTVLPLMRYWGFVEARSQAPGDRDLGPFLDRVGYNQMELLPGRRIRCQDGVEVDFGGIAKGYAVDLAARELRARGIRNALVDAGGDICVFGRTDRNLPWKVGIRDPRRPSQLFAVVEIGEEAVATSGGYEKFKTIEDKRMPHLLDPGTGRGAEKAISATILAPTTVEADALATAAFIMGPETGLDLIGQFPGVEGIWVTPDGSRCVSPGLTGRVQWM